MLKKERHGTGFSFLDGAAVRWSLGAVLPEAAFSLFCSVTLSVASSVMLRGGCVKKKRVRVCGLITWVSKGKKCGGGEWGARLKMQCASEQRQQLGCGVPSPQVGLSELGPRGGDHSHDPWRRLPCLSHGEEGHTLREAHNKQVQLDNFPIEVD